eukprot:330285-Rhodomonas_salina.6
MLPGAKVALVVTHIDCVAPAALARQGDHLWRRNVPFVAIMLLFIEAMLPFMEVTLTFKGGRGSARACARSQSSGWRGTARYALPAYARSTDRLASRRLEVLNDCESFQVDSKNGGAGVVLYRLAWGPTQRCDRVSGTESGYAATRNRSVQSSVGTRSAENAGYRPMALLCGVLGYAVAAYAIALRCPVLTNGVVVGYHELLPAGWVRLQVSAYARGPQCPVLTALWWYQDELLRRSMSKGYLTVGEYRSAAKAR